MKNANLILFSFIISLIVFGCSKEEETFPDLEGDYLGQPAPGMLPQIFAGGVISTGMHEQNASFSPDGSEFLFTMATPYQEFNTIMYMKRENGEWSEPVVAPFSGRFSDIDPFYSYDGKKIVFVSNRPDGDNTAPQDDYDIWIVEKNESGFAEPFKFSDEVNSPEDEYYPSLTENGDLYFSSGREEGFGTWDIYRSEFADGKYRKPENLGAGINSKYRDWDPFIAPDGSYIIFTSDRSGGYGGADLYISHRDTKGWSAPLNLGENINTGGYEYCPSVTKDGLYFFFSRFSGSEENFYPAAAYDYNSFTTLIKSPENGLGNIYWLKSGPVIK